MSEPTVRTLSQRRSPSTPARRRNARTLPTHGPRTRPKRRPHAEPSWRRPQPSSPPSSKLKNRAPQSLTTLLALGPRALNPHRSRSAKQRHILPAALIEYVSRFDIGSIDDALETLFATLLRSPLIAGEA